MSRAKVQRVSDEDKKSIVVICPTCYNTRKIKMYWTGGNVVPRIRCDRCKQLVKKYGNISLLER